MIPDYEHYDPDDILYDHEDDTTEHHPNVFNPYEGLFDDPEDYETYDD